MSAKILRIIAAYTVFGLFLPACLPVVQAATVEWIASGDGDWNTPANWSTGTLPGADDEVIVNRGTPVTITHAGSDTLVRSLNLTGTLALTGGSITLLAGASQITANLILSNGATLTATNPQTVLTVAGTASIDGGNLYALNGAHISLPGTTQYWGSGVFRAQGPGSRLELTNLSGIGIPLPGNPLTEITDAVSREISVYHQPSAPPPEITDAVSREVSVYHRSPEPPSDGPAMGILNAASREVSVYHRPPEPPSDGPAMGILDATSREVSVYHRPPEPPADGPAKGILDATSREVSVENPVTPP